MACPRRDTDECVPYVDRKSLWSDTGAQILFRLEKKMLIVEYLVNGPWADSPQGIQFVSKPREDTRRAGVNHVVDRV